MQLFFSVGEPSGDLHGANLIRELRRGMPEIRCVGFGGPQMAAAGCELHEDLTKLAVMWVLRVLLNIHKFWNLAGQADRYFRYERPDAVVLIDYPGFNWWIARRAKAHGIPVIYYGTPQIWAWASWRVGKMRRLVDHALCKLPFEEAWYRQRGCNATYVGHPFFDEVRRYQSDAAFIADCLTGEGPLVGVLPGSRTQEVTSNLPQMLKAAKLVHRRVPEARFAVAAFKEAHAELARRLIDAAALPESLQIEVYVRRTPEIMRHATCTMAVSGSVSLELLYYSQPTVVLYCISRGAFVLQNFFRRVRYITLVNLLVADRIFRRSPWSEMSGAAVGGDVLFPEYITSGDRSSDIAAHVTHWLTEPERRTELVERLDALREQVTAGGASQRGAAYILKVLESRRRTKPQPHCVPGSAGTPAATIRPSRAA